MREEEYVRKQVKSLKRFYIDSFTFAGVNAILILIWVLVDRSTTFWPKYVIVIWGLSLMFKAYRTGILPLFFHHFSFLTPEWEREKNKRTHERSSRAEKNIS